MPYGEHGRFTQSDCRKLIIKRKFLKDGLKPSFFLSDKWVSPAVKRRRLRRCLRRSFFLREKVRFYKNGTADKNNTNLAKRRQTTVRIIYILHRCGRYKKIGL